MSDINRTIIYDHDTFFDKGDQHNASLYLGFSIESSQVLLDELVALFRNHNLWSNDTPEVIAHEQKSAYVEQLTFVEAIKCQTAGGNEFIVSCFNHEKFPYNEARWQSWKIQISGNYDTTVIEP